MPPVARKLPIQVRRAAWAESGPSLTTAARSGLPAAVARSAASRNASKGSASLAISRRGAIMAGFSIGGSPLGHGSALTPSGPSSGKAETPVSSRAPVATALRRACNVRSRRAWKVPLATAFAMPPSASIAWKISQALRARSSVSFSTYQLPPAGSTTRPRPLSSISTSWVLRAMRRAKASGRPSA